MDTPTTDAAPPLPLPSRIGVVGCGLMGSGIAEVCARAGLDVAVAEVDDDAAKRGPGAHRASLAAPCKPAS